MHFSTSFPRLDHHPYGIFHRIGMDKPNTFFTPSTQAYDVTNILRPGKNTLASLLGFGWYALPDNNGFVPVLGYKTVGVRSLRALCTVLTASRNHPLPHRYLFSARTLSAVPRSPSCYPPPSPSVASWPPAAEPARLHWHLLSCPG